MRKAATSPFLSVAGAAAHPEAFATDVYNATEENLRSVSR